MIVQADLLLADAVGRPVAVVEAKRVSGWDDARTDEFLADVAEVCGWDEFPFVVIAFPERVHVYRRGEARGWTPLARIDARPLWDPYLRRAGITDGRVMPMTFEMIVGQFFGDLTSGYGPSVGPAGDSLRVAAGELTELLAGGRLEYEAV